LTKKKKNATVANYDFFLVKCLLMMVENAGTCRRLGV
jgi:hypothetical protein